MAVLQTTINVSELTDEVMSVRAIAKGDGSVVIDPATGTQMRKIKLASGLEAFLDEGVQLIPPPGKMVRCFVYGANGSRPFSIDMRVHSMEIIKAA